MGKAEFEAMSRKEYTAYLSDERVLEYIAQACFDIHGLREKLEKGPKWQKSIDQIKELIYNCDKHMFFKFKEREITKD